MKRRTYYTLGKGYAPIKHVLLIQPDEQGEVYVYCPPDLVGGRGSSCAPPANKRSWQILSGERDQLVVKAIQQKVDWRLDGLDQIEVSDERSL
jgi:hypothetical protein